MPSVKRRCPPWLPHGEVLSTLRGSPDGERDRWVCERSSGVWWGTQTAAEAGSAAADGCSATEGPGRHRCRSRGWGFSWCGAPLFRYYVWAQQFAAFFKSYCPEENKLLALDGAKVHLSAFGLLALVRAKVHLIAEPSKLSHLIKALHNKSA